MKRLNRCLSVLLASTFFIVACGAQKAQAREDPPPTTLYQMVLGKSLSNNDVADFLINANCSAAGQFQLCKNSGIAFWVNSENIIKTVYLYASNSDGFARYTGTLPYGLSFYDPMWRVEEKIKNMEAKDSTLEPAQAADGSPDEESVPDYLHYWAVYRRLGMVVIYNCPYPDEDAYIYAILIRD